MNNELTWQQTRNIMEDNATKGKLPHIRWGQALFNENLFITKWTRMTRLDPFYDDHIDEDWWSEIEKLWNMLKAGKAVKEIKAFIAQTEGE